MDDGRAFADLDGGERRERRERRDAVTSDDFVTIVARLERCA